MPLAHGRRAFASVLCGKRRTQREVAEVAGVTEVTIRNRYKELIQNLNIELEIWGPNSALGP